MGPMRRWLIQSVPLIGLAIPLSAGSSTRPATPVEIDALIHQLSGDTSTARQEAQDRLVQLGPSVEARLEQLLRETHDEEAAARAQAALRIIRENRQIGATRVTLHLKDVDAAEAFKELAAQSQTEIMPEPPQLWAQKERAKVSIDADSEDFWSVMLQLCKQAHLEPDVSEHRQLKVLESTEGNWAQSPSVVAGPVLVQATGVTLTKDVKFNNPGNVDQSCELSLAAYTEPRLRLLRDLCTASIESVVDDKGNSLRAADAEEPALSSAGDTNHVWEMNVELTYPANVGQKISSLKGTLHLVVPIKLETLDVPDLLNVRNLSRTIAGRRFVIQKARKVQGGYEVKVTVYRDAMTDAEWQQLTNPKEFIRLADDKDRTIYFTGVGEIDGGDKQTTLTLQFENPNNMPNGVGGPVGKPTRLVWEIPLEAKEVKVPFEFKDLRLP